MGGRGGSCIRGGGGGAQRVYVRVERKQTAVSNAYTYNWRQTKIYGNLWFYSRNLLFVNAQIGLILAIEKIIN